MKKKSGNSISEVRGDILIIRNGSFEKLRDEVINSDKKIVVYGAGVLGAITAAAIINEYAMNSYLDSYVDNDIYRQQDKVKVGKDLISVHAVSYLLEFKSEDIVVILAVSRCGQILEELETFENLKNCSCYILPMMCIMNFGNKEIIFNNRQSDIELIPKKIHYFWLGGKNIPLHLQKCIDSWKKFCPDYEIIRWDENNYDISKNAYMKEPYKAKAYGFVPDYARLDVLYQYGGIYLDTDVELIKSLDDLLYQDAFCGVEKWQTLNFGGCSGSKKHSIAIGEFLKAREGEHFVYEDGHLNTYTCGYIDTLVAMRYGYTINGKNQKILDMNIYSSDYFHPYDYMSRRLEITANTFSIHHFNGGWLDENMRSENKRISDNYNELERIAK